MIDLEQRAARMAPPRHWMPLGLERGVQVSLHYRWSQIARRLRRVLGRRLRGGRMISVPPARSLVKAREDLQSLAGLAWKYIGWRAAACSDRSDLLRGSIVLLNERRDLGVPMDWRFARTARPSHLWRFQLHYHEFLLPLVKNGMEQDFRQAWIVIGDWIDKHQIGSVKADEDAWHPYCISRRMPVWIWLLAMGQPAGDGEKILGSLHAQARYLAVNLEIDPGGNHLLENLFGLGIAACYFDGPDSDAWFDLVEGGLRRELPVQILDHGEHFERSPMYHCQVAANLLALAHTSNRLRPELAKVCLEYALRMIEFLASILHPDGEIPLFADSGFGESPSVSLLRELVILAGLEWPQSQESKTIGPYWVHRNAGSALIFDAGSVGAKELPAHSHCDLLGLEVSLDGRRWFVDSGNFNYESDSMRRYCRSSVAHNVVVIDDREQCDIWSKFRMGFRGEPTKFESGQRAGADWAVARHDAYRRSRVRWIERLVVGWGDVSMCCDFANTDRRPKLTGYLHLAPELAVKRTGDRRFEISDQSTCRRIDFFGVDDVDVGEGWYCPGFGQRIRNQCFVYRQTAGPMTATGWLLDSMDGASSVELDGRRLYLRVATANFEWSFE